MVNPSTISCFGRDHDGRGMIHLQALDAETLVLGTSAGTTAKPNEDALGISSSGLDLVLAIADGHWGREASELAVSRAMALLGPEVHPPRESETRARLFSLFEQVNNQLYEMAIAAPGASTPETTLIVCHIKEADSGKYLYWASFGDSFLFLLRDGRLRQANSLHPRWLGYLSKLSEKADTRSILMRFMTDEARYVGVASGLETGIEKLEPGDILFLCTDGLVGSDREPAPTVLAELSENLNADRPLVSRVEEVISSALRRGELDNISCVAALIPPAST